MPSISTVIITTLIRIDIETARLACTELPPAFSVNDEATIEAGANATTVNACLITNSNFKH